jgi:hypothetical protein
LRDLLDGGPGKSHDSFLPTPNEGHSEMLSSLDIVIAFAVIMTVLCLMITTLVQMVSTAFSLRGKNLANALSLTFQTIDPHIAEQAHALTEHILKDPIFSDSLFTPKGREKSANAKVTFLRQKPWTFRSRGGMHLASAIRPDEVYRVLQGISQLTESEADLRRIPHILAEKSAAILAALKQPDQPARESLLKLQAIHGIASHFPSDGEKRAIIDSVANLGLTVERATTQAYDRFERWFGSAQDRAQQWFQVHIRGLTITFSILTAFLLQLDTTDIFRQLRDRPGLVDALVKSAPGVLDQGARVLDSSNTPAYHAYLLWLRNHSLFPLAVLPTPGTPELFHQSIAERIKTTPDKNYPVERFDAAFALARKTAGTAKTTEAEAANAAYKDWIREFPGFQLDPAVFTDATTRESISSAISEKIANDPTAQGTPAPAQATQWLTEYDALKTDGVIAYEKARQESFRSLQATMNEAGFDLVPKPFLSRWDKEPVPYWTRSYPPQFGHFLRHILGVLITVGLLALGAPFWFNLLKNLMNLRPAVANLVEQRPRSTPAATASSPG